MRPVATHLAAAVVAIGTLSPAPAVAQQDVAEQDDAREAIGQAIAGAALLGLFGLALSERDDDDDDDNERDARAERRKPDDHGWIPPGQRRNWIPPGHRRDGPAPGHRWEPRRAALPLSCLRQHDTARGPVSLFDGGCLEHRFGDVHALPFDCAILLDAHGRLVSGYVPRCLRDDGFEYADR